MKIEIKTSLIASALKEPFLHGTLFNGKIVIQGDPEPVPFSYFSQNLSS
jgi:hypothetical protein